METLPLGELTLGRNLDLLPLLPASLQFLDCSYSKTGQMIHDYNVYKRLKWNYYALKFGPRIKKMLAVTRNKKFKNF